MNIFPAHEGTFLVERHSDGVRTYTPVVGWCHVQGNIAFPICAINHGGLTHGRAVVHPNGFVTDPTHGHVFESADEWLNFIAHAKPPETAEDERSDDRAAKMPEEPSKPSGGAPSPESKPSTPEVEIAFGNKTFKTNSYWTMRGTGFAAIFQIEGGQPLPKDGLFEKITRDEWQALKKEGHLIVKPVPAKAAPEDDDDDGMDLV